MINSTLKRAVAVAMLAGASVGANAASDTFVGESGNSLDLTTMPTTFSGVVSGAVTGINDIFNINSIIGGNVGSSYTVADLPLNNGAWDLEFASLSLWSTGANGAQGGGDDVLLKSVIVPASGSTQNLISLNYDQALTAPAYLHVAGVTSGTEGGVYGGSAVAIVPEPESFAMLLAGLGLMGAVVRRRSSKKTS